MNIFLLVILLAACEGQPPSIPRSVITRSRSFIDESVNEELRILKEELIRTNARLQELETTQQDQHGRLFETILTLYKILFNNCSYLVKRVGMIEIFTMLLNFIS